MDGRKVNLNLAVQYLKPDYTLILFVQSLYLICKATKLYRKDIKMNLKQYIIAGVIEQAIVFAFILPATGWWFSFFGLTAVWNLVAGGFRK